jgi:hypothetical protein
MLLSGKELGRAGGERMKEEKG